MRSLAGGQIEEPVEARSSTLEGELRGGRWIAVDSSRVAGDGIGGSPAGLSNRRAARPHHQGETDGERHAGPEQRFQHSTIISRDVLGGIIALPGSGRMLG